MPRINRQNVPRALFQQLLNRIQNKEAQPDHMVRFAEWLDKAPNVPGGAWYKKFSKFTVCGQGDLITFLLPPNRSPDGKAVK